MYIDDFFSKGHYVHRSNKFPMAKSVKKSIGNNCFQQISDRKMHWDYFIGKIRSGQMTYVPKEPPTKNMW